MRRVKCTLTREDRGGDVVRLLHVRLAHRAGAGRGECKANDQRRPTVFEWFRELASQSRHFVCQEGGKDIGRQDCGTWRSAKVFGLEIIAFLDVIKAPGFQSISTVCSVTLHIHDK